eukprot:5253163-Pleurochrysis_carterae.AAC.1
MDAALGLGLDRLQMAPRSRRDGALLLVEHPDLVVCVARWRGAAKWESVRAKGGRDASTRPGGRW